VAEGHVHGHRTWPPGLPMPVTRLIGRERDLAEVTALVAANRLVTLVGSGGVGKTRLAIEAAAAATSRFTDGMDLVDLSGVADPELVWATVAKAVGVEERADADLAVRLTAVLRTEIRLLILDSCEHLLAACASVATRLLGYCPELRMLVTSREGLGVPGEITWRVPSLTFPWPEHLPVLAELETFGAAALFADRARAVRPGLVITATDIAALSSICFRLDGIPLALELAAARASALTIREIADHLDDRFILPTRTAGGPARHQTLRASVGWSHQLLSPLERVLFHRLAVFSGGWSLRAAETIGSGTPIEPGQIVRLLAALVDKSLVQAEHTVSGTRYRLLGAIRTFAQEQLEASGEADEVRSRHGGYFADLAEHVAVLLHGPDQGRWAYELDQDHANLRAARQWCAENPARTGLGLKMASGLGEYWLIRGLLAEGTDWLSETLEQAPDADGTKAAALTWLAVFTSLRSGFQRGRQLFEESIVLHEQAGDRNGGARALAIFGFWLANQDDRQRAAEAFDSALALTTESGDRYFAAFVLLMGSMIAAAANDQGLAKARASDSVNLFIDIGDRRGAGYARCVLAECLVREGEPGEGLAILGTSVSDFEGMLDRWGMLVSTGTAALAYAALGDWSRTAIAAGVADSLSERIGSQLAPAVQAPIDAITARTTARLGMPATALREAGRTAGRGDRIARALGLHAETALPSPQQDLPLTERENEVARLIVAGLTNRQIAVRLVIAQRTVDTHVAHILAKLGCSNRAQVAALISAHSRPDTSAGLAADEIRG
jgi:predicted ATPase/DNA-binding CsgD family transcriptional regulator